MPPTEAKRAGLPVIAFADLAAWEAWLAGQPADAMGLWLKLAKTGNAESSLTKAQAIDGALCHGWIDGQIDKYDDGWFLTRFTPRSPRSKWSERNCARVAELIAAQRVSPAGLAAIESAKPMDDGTPLMPPPRPRSSPTICARRSTPSRRPARSSTR